MPEFEMDPQFAGSGRTQAQYQAALQQPTYSAPNRPPSLSNFGGYQAQMGVPYQQKAYWPQPNGSQYQSIANTRFSAMPPVDDEEEKKKLAEEDAAGEGARDLPLDDTPVLGDDAVADPQIMTMTGAAPADPLADPLAPAAPGGDPAMVQRTLAGPGGPEGPGGMGHHGFGGMGQGGHHGWLQQLFQRMQERRQQMQGHRGERMQQFLGTPQGQHFAESRMGQQMQSRHPDWFPAAPGAGAPAGAAPAAGAPPAPTAAAAANAAAQAPAAAPAPAATAPAAPAPAAPAAPRAPSPDRQQPMGRAQAPQMNRQPMFGGGASRAIQDAMRKRNGGGGMMGGGGGGRRMF